MAGCGDRCNRVMQEVCNLQQSENVPVPPLYKQPCYRITRRKLIASQSEVGRSGAQEHQNGSEVVKQRCACLRRVVVPFLHSSLREWNVQLWWGE